MPECSGAPNVSKPASAELAVDHRLMREGAAGAAIFLRHRGAEQTGRAGLGPHLALVHAVLVPALEMRHELGSDEAARLLLEQHEVLGHPGRAGKIENVHGESSPTFVQDSARRAAAGATQPSAADVSKCYLTTRHRSPTAARMSGTSAHAISLGSAAGRRPLGQSALGC